MAIKLPRGVLEWLIFGGGGERRYTQDSPVLPDVWIGYGQHPGEALELLLTPDRQATAGGVAVALRRRLGLEGPEGEVAEIGHGIAYMPSSVAARLTLAELVHHVLPMTLWWRQSFWKRQRQGDEEGEKEEPRSVFDQVRKRAGIRSTGQLRAHLARRLGALDAAGAGAAAGETVPDRRWVKAPGERPPADPVPADLLWMMRIVGWLAWAEGRESEEPPPEPDPEALDAWRAEHGPSSEQVVTALFALVGEKLPPPEGDAGARVFQIHRNRSAELAVAESRQAVKADAAERLFEISCARLQWAVIDSGIDATHPAFRCYDREGRPYEHPFGGDPAKPQNRTRVVATYDFTRVRRLLNPASLHPDRLPEELADLAPLLSGPGERAERLRTQLDDLRKRLRFGREVDWELLEPFLQVPHEYERYWYPTNDHGTHVAGILAADWRRGGDDELEGDVQGICPDLNLYDLRVLPRGGGGPDDEFNVIAALQFVRHLNLQKSYQVVHGVNLSLSIPHEVANFACGRTPVCEECERVVSSGVVVVAAAGNNGYLRYHTAQGEKEGYHTLSVTDPGNAEAVITVGATHRNRPHTYGVSYFSSRGPTGDGRSKPDLVAPGEKITAPVPGGGESEKDGTSMAAPHASGAAAMLMARYNELVGRPQEIKRILCASATDLGRERYFQGCGMLDVLRALQSV